MNDKPCPKCCKSLPVDRFNIRTNGRPYSWCKSCTSAATKHTNYYSNAHQRRRRKENPFKTMAHQAKARHVGDYNISEAFLWDLWDKQEGKCYWFGVPLTLEVGDRRHDQVSIDRLDNSKGYTQDNVVLCSWFANRGRSNGNAEEFRAWVELLRKSLVQNAEPMDTTTVEITSANTKTSRLTATLAAITP